MVDVTGDYYGYPLIPTETIAGRELKQKTDPKDEVWVTINSYTDNTGKNREIDEGVVLTVRRVQNRTSTHLYSDKVEAILFEDSQLLRSINHPIREVSFDLHKVVRPDSPNLTFTSIGQLVEEETSSTETFSNDDQTRVYDP